MVFLENALLLVSYPRTACRSPSPRGSPAAGGIPPGDTGSFSAPRQNASSDLCQAPTRRAPHAADRS